MTYTDTQIKDSIKRLTEFYNKNKRLPQTIKIGNNTLTIKEYIQLKQLQNSLTNAKAFCKENNRMPNTINISEYTVNKELFTKLFNWECTPNKENTKDMNTLQYFESKYGKINTIDEGLTKIKNKGYASYYNGKYTNKQTIDQIKKGNGANCTDSSQVFFSIAKSLGYTVHCIHVECKTGGGHVRLKLKHPKHTKGNWINRDPAAVLSKNAKTVKDIWCSNGKLIDTDPTWFMAGVNK